MLIVHRLAFSPFSKSLRELTSNLRSSAGDIEQGTNGDSGRD
jgi:hypothetical protein